MNTGLSTKKRIDPRDVHISELELGSSENKTRWGMTNKEISKLKVENQGSYPICVGETGAKMMEKLYGGDYSEWFAYVNTDRIYERSNKGGLHVINMMKFLTTFGIVKSSFVKKDIKKDFDDAYSKTPTIVDALKQDKKFLGAYMRVDSRVESIKQGLENLDVMAISVFQYRVWNTRINGRRMKRFYSNPRAKEGHAMMVTHMELIDGKHHLFLWNSWDDGQAVLVLEDFPPNSIIIDGGTTKKDIIEKVKEKVIEKKAKYPDLENFTVVELKDVSTQMAIDLQGIRDVTKELTKLYFNHDKGVAMIINSGKRSVAHNKRVGGVPDSEHITGDGVDVRAKNGYERSMITQAIYIYYWRKGIKPRVGQSWKSLFIHIGIGEKKPKPTTWTY